MLDGTTPPSVRSEQCPSERHVPRSTQHQQRVSTFEQFERVELTIRHCDRIPSITEHSSGLHSDASHQALLGTGVFVSSSDAAQQRHVLITD